MALVQYFHALTPVPNPVCSVCIANFNGVHMLAECLDSVLAQDIDAPVEIFVYDDASTDDSVAFLRERYPQVALLVGAGNVGFCVANNRMVAQARGEFVLLLNNDAALHADALRTLVAEARNRESRGVFTLPQYDWLSGELVDRGCLLDPFYNPVPNLDPARRDVAYVIGACLFTSRALWNELGGFPDWIGSIGEDMYLCCLGRLRGLPVAVTPGSGYRHRQGASFGGNRIDSDKLNTTFRRRALSERNKTAVMVICTPTWLVWPLLAAHLIALTCECLVLSLLRRDAKLLREVYLPALATPFRECVALRARRNETQARRTISVAKWFSVVRWQLRKLTMLRRYGVPTVR